MEHNIEEVRVIDDFLPPRNFKEIQNLLLSPAFNWFYNDHAVQQNDNSYIQFVHAFYGSHYNDFHGKYGVTQSDFFKYMFPILDRIDPPVRILTRIKANLTLPITKNNKDYFFHKDSLNKEGMAAVYYVNTNNGATVFGDGRAVESKENRLVVFPITLDHGVKRHTSGSKVRVVINFNWLPTV